MDEITDKSIERALYISKIYAKRRQIILCLISSDEELSEILIRKNARNINDELLNPTVFLWEGNGGAFMWIGCKNNPNAIISAEFSDEDCTVDTVEVS